ncbi:hypothetical protein EVAR_5858_1 [Eumeta japonica]|uniref:Uncharacterized protein n=1 Tax=Eumeta variegata TaxID=151549 RepID=A0A4C1TCT6_EUMVA|nr:hypothetical protein EVAR_5858_1 [Eumeta japonica]
MVPTNITNAKVWCSSAPTLTRAAAARAGARGPSDRGWSYNFPGSYFFVALKYYPAKNNGLSILRLSSSGEYSAAQLPTAVEQSQRARP